MDKTRIVYSDEVFDSLNERKLTMAIYALVMHANRKVSRFRARSRVEVCLLMVFVGA